MMDRVEAFIATKYSDPREQRLLADLFIEHESMGLVTKHFVTELTAVDDKHKFNSCLWEMLLARRLRKQGFDILGGDPGPDFRFEIDGLTVWIEAICPKPNGLSKDWLSPPKPGCVRVFSVPHREMTLRWTAAIKEKKEKLDNYRTNRTVDERDAYVIAVNAGCLSIHDSEEGISGAPMVAEAVFPVGPLAVPVLDGPMFGDPFYSARFSITNANSSEVPTTSFLNPTYAGVSAILGCSSLWIDGEAPFTVIHNPLANSPLPTRLFDGATEYVADENGESYSLRRIS